MSAPLSQNLQRRLRTMSSPYGRCRIVLRPSGGCLLVSRTPDTWYLYCKLTVSWQLQNLHQVVCTELVPKTFSPCGHVAQVQCVSHMIRSIHCLADGQSRRILDDRCPAACGVVLECCGQPCPSQCTACHDAILRHFVSDDTISALQLETVIERTIHVPHPCLEIHSACGHACGGDCTPDHQHPDCLARCETECSHRKCDKACSAPCSPCTSLSPRTSVLTQYVKLTIR